MHVVIPKPLEAFVRRGVEEGRYATEVDVIADALRLMQARDEVAAMKRKRLRNALARGYEDVAAGRVIEPDPFGALTPHLAPVRATDRASPSLATHRSVQVDTRYRTAGQPFDAHQAMATASASISPIRRRPIFVRRSVSSRRNSGSSGL